ncbi:helix-turn-helix domain-containing protein [Nocardia gamkensis]|uniref:helix-turn-helix domain-containing protein n=1 Tax=Nocardia gamkensis TaxID=352869 RepID=UPI0037C6C573
MQDKIGPALKQARQDRRSSLREVAAAVGISASQLSQIENNKSQPSVSTLYALVNHLEISLDELLGLRPGRSGGPVADVPDRSGTRVVQRGADNPVLEMANGVRWEKLAVGPDSDVDALLVTYEPGAASSLDRMPMRHSGTEYAYLLTGELTLLLGFDRYTIGAGDSLWFDSTQPHLYVNQSDQPACGVWFVSGRLQSGPTREWVAAQLGQAAPAGSVQVNSAVDALDLLGGPQGRSPVAGREI